MATKTMQINPGVDPVLLDLVRKAEPALDHVLGRFADRVDVVWEPGPDAAGQPTARIALTDEGVRRTREFTAWDMEDEVQLRRGLRDVWDRVLAERIQIHLGRLRQMAEAEEG